MLRIKHPIDLDLDRSVRRDRSNPMKKRVRQAPTIFYYRHVRAYTIMSYTVPTSA